jgi:hypothetical protein
MKSIQNLSVCSYTLFLILNQAQEIDKIKTFALEKSFFLEESKVFLRLTHRFVARSMGEKKVK